MNSSKALVILHFLMNNKEINLSKEMLQEIVASSVDSILVINNRGVIQYVNDATLKMFLYEREELIGEKINILMPNPDRANHDQYLDNYHRTGQKKIIGIGREVVALKNDGRKFSCLLSISEVKVEDETFYTGILHDISALKATEEQLIVLNRSLEAKVSERTEMLSDVVSKLRKTNSDLIKEVELRKKTEIELNKNRESLKKSLDKEMELSNLKSRFLTMASHEFKTPLSTILSSSNLIKKYNALNDNEKVDNHLSKIGNTINHLTTILNDFLSLGKWDEGRIKVQKEYFSFKEIIENIISNINGSLKNGQVIKVEIDDVNIYTDKELLKNTLINLIANASKYSKENQEILITGYIENDNILIKVKDLGIGIPKDAFESIFERFFRASNVTNIEGTGIGLNLVKNYITILGGEISFISEEGKGSIFLIKLPISNE